jgi:hypothetical protein
VRNANDLANHAYLVQKFTPDPLKKLPVNESGSKADLKKVDAVADIDWPNLIDKLGVPVAALAAIGYAIYSTIKWIGNNILIPIHQRHLLFLDRLETSIEKICNTQVDQNSQIINLANKISQTKDKA